MNKKDLIPVIILALLIPTWMFIDRTFIAPKFPAQPAPTEQSAEETPTAGAALETALSDARVEAEAKLETAVVETAEPPAEEKLAILGNNRVKLELTSIGGGVKTATLQDFPKLKGGEERVVLDFSTATALAYSGLAGIGANDSLSLQALDGGKSAVFSKAWNSGTAFERTITLGDGYLVTVKDRFINTGTDPWNLPAIRIQTGYMQNPADMKAMKGVSILGVDSYTPTGGINYWGKKINKLYKTAGKPGSLDAIPEGMHGEIVDWVSAKNKFFTQIIRPDEPAATMAVLSTRDMNEKGIVPQNIAAALAFKPAVVNPGSAFELGYTYYIGPKNYSILKAAGNNMEGVMEFETIGTFSWMNWLMEPARRFLLWTMNKFHLVIPNYGVAIILLTLLIRILFWPLTHKSTESMKRMQEIQPEIKALQEKYKKDPQRMQQETMKLYKEKKVNPMGGCLPMFIQIPVFIALFTVLRNAIELRYSGFLWIADLSQPENLFAGKVPFVGALNILPIVMSISMIWQQKLTSPATAATPEQQQQQKMMMFMMPIMMLFFFYSMPSGLVLYWTTSNLLMIAQTGIRNVRKKVKEA